MKKYLDLILVLVIALVFCFALAFAGEQWITEDGTILTRQDRIVVDGEVYGLGDYDNPEKLAEMKAKPFVEIKKFDENYYKADSHIDSQDTDIVTRIYTKKPKMTLKDLKDRKKREAKRQLKATLSFTDNEVLECLELGIAIPAETAIKRKAARDAYDAEVIRVDTFSDYDALVIDEGGLSDAK